MEETRAKLKQFVQDLLEDQGVQGEVVDGEALISSGLLDSLAVFQIVLFMEKEFALDFSALFFDQTRFDSIDEMLRFVEEGLKADDGQPGGERS